MEVMIFHRILKNRVCNVNPDHLTLELSISLYDIAHHYFLSTFECVCVRIAAIFSCYSCLIQIQ
jgi:hypothetical protein